MNDCEQTERVGAYHDGEMGPAERAAMERHVGACRACAAELARVRALSALLGQAAPGGQGAEAEVSARGMRRFHAAAARAAGGPTWGLLRAMTGVAAAILLGCAAGLWAMSRAGGAGEAPAEWEISMMQRPGDAQAGGEDDQPAAWVAEELSRENAHEPK